ncbi:MAG: hypothetical protein R3C41_13270 [Calditrichia bacterium]|nr:hypothetical protein [Calditrichota bacterium]MCB0266638.1 hypothetical protein [Calditrichota bacterium]MCB0285578.1 hypothetical protein [Calditrichota bacterium]MCB9067211.1 hypothetical protein [Calditrichia bacterium]
MKTLYKSNIFVKILPVIVASSFAIFWAIIYVSFMKLHRMPTMFDQQFPFFLATLLGVHNESMPVVSGILFAMLDAGIFGLVFGWVFRSILKGVVNSASK